MTGDIAKICAVHGKSPLKVPVPEGHGYNVERKGDVVTINIYGRDDKAEGGDIFSSSCVLDIAKGCSMVGQHHVSSQSETHWELDYAKRNGILVPRQIGRAIWRRAEAWADGGRGDVP